MDVLKYQSPTLKTHILCLQKKEVSKYSSSVDVYYMLIQNLVHAVGVEFRKKGTVWGIYSDNSIEFVSQIKNFPLEMKKSLVDQLCELDESISKYLYTVSQNQSVSRLLQELDYIK